VPDGDDFLRGAGGADTFVFDVARDQGTDWILEFDGSRDRLAFAGITDANAPGLADDLDAVTTVRDPGAAEWVTVDFTSGTTLVFLGIATGSVDSLADLVDDLANQLLLA